MSSRPTVMISSTARDLPEHRGQARLGCHRAGFSSEQMMENLTALDEDAVSISLKMVEEADIYIGIFAQRYGFVPKGESISITEMEYNKAVELGKPRLIFFAHKAHQFTAEDFEIGEASMKLKALKERIGDERVAAFFKSPEDLRGHIGEALSALRKKLESDEPIDPKAVVQRLHRRTAIPAPPKPYIAHPYTLSQTRDLVGRRDELNALTDWVTKPGSPAYGNPVFCFVAIGGMGKSALTWKWFNDIAPQEMPDLAGRLWWSFYESDAHFENFLNRALCYVDEFDEDYVRNMPWHDREALLLQHLSERKFLVVLDGLERILLAYNRMDASSLADDEYDEQTANVAGATGLPASAAQSFIGQHRLRQTTDPRAGYFLRKVAQVQDSRILISTRLFPFTLQIPNMDTCPGCSAHFLKGLSDEDAVSLWRQLGVSGSRQELVPLFRSFERHPLLVQALAGEIARDRKTPGNFAAWRKNNPSFDPGSLQPTQAKSHILQHALAGLDEGLRKTLTDIVALRTPATYDTLEALLVGGNGKTFRCRQALDQALTELEDRGLIGWDREANRYDAHPIVRGVVWQLTDNQARSAVYESIQTHFEHMTLPDHDQVESITDLTPAIERYYTLVMLGRYTDACTILQSWLADAALGRLSAYAETASWLELLVFNSNDLGEIVNSSHLQSYILNILAMSYLRIGRYDQAMPLFQRRIEIAKKLGDAKESVIGHSSLGFAYRWFGALRNSANELHKAHLLMQRSPERIEESAILLQIGHVNTAVGNLPIGIIALRRCLSLLRIERKRSPQVHAMVGLGSVAIRQEKYRLASAIADQAWIIASEERRMLEQVRASLFQGSSSTYLGNIPKAEEKLNFGLVAARSLNLLSDEIFALISLALLELKINNYSKAKSILRDIWEITPPGSVESFPSTSYNCLASICRAEGDEDGAIEAATKAYRAAWCDGPPWAYHWGLEKAKTHLQALGAPEPDMPPFDESKYEKMPEVEINPKDEHWVDPSVPLEALLDLETDG